MNLIRGLGLASVLLALWIGWLHGPALTLPPSLIDDATHLLNGERMRDRLGRGEWGQALQQDQSIRIGLRNPGHSMVTTAAYSLSGGTPYHGIKLLQLWLVGVAIILIPLVARPLGVGTRQKAVLITAGLVAAFLFAAAEIPGTSGFQSLMANWWRLHTSDSDAAVPVAYFLLAVAALTGRRSKEWSGLVRLGWIAVAAIGYGAAVLIKPPTAVLGGVVAVAGWVAVVQGSRRSGWVLAGVGVGLTAGAGLWLIGLGSMIPNGTSAGVNSHVYASAYGAVQSPANLLRRIASMVTQIIHGAGMAGPLIGGLALVTLTRFPGGWAAWIRRHGAEAMLGLGALGLLAVYVPWPHDLPRYLLLGGLALAGWSALILADGFRRIVLVAARYPKYQPASAIAGGLVMLVLVHAGWMGLQSSRQLTEGYGEQENRQWEMVRFLAQQVRQGQLVGLAPMVPDERIGSLEYFIGRELQQSDWAFVRVAPAGDRLIPDGILILRQPELDSPGTVDEGAWDRAGYRRIHHWDPPENPLAFVPSPWTHLMRGLLGQASSITIPRTDRWELYSKVGKPD